MRCHVPRVYLILWLSILLLVIALPVSIFNYSLHHEAQIDAIRDETASAKLVTQIVEMRSIVPDSKPKDDDPSNTISRIRESLLITGLDERQLVDVRILGEVQIPKTPFSRRDVSIRLKGVELEALFKFISNEETQTPGITCSQIDIQLSKGASEAVRPSWDAQLTLTHLVEAAKNAQGK